MYIREKKNRLFSRSASTECHIWELKRPFVNSMVYFGVNRSGVWYFRLKHVCGTGNLRRIAQCVYTQGCSIYANVCVALGYELLALLEF